MDAIQAPIQIRNFTVKNRVVLPPLVICSLHPDGQVNDAVLDHYESFARGGCGIIIQEATCVRPEGRLAGPQLGIWDDSAIEGMKRIAGRVLPYGALLLMQIHYASTQGEPDNVVQIGPSAYENRDGVHRALSLEEVERIRDGFIDAAVRAEKAGYHGVELHGAHGYLLCAFMNAKYNRRDDRYGDTTQLVSEIIAGIRQVTGPEFILTARVGVDNPDMATGIANCKVLEAAGLDLLNISSGMGRQDKLPIPQGFPFSELAWLGCEIKKQVKLPVIAVGKLNDPALAQKLVSEGWADFAALGRGLLVDPEWANKVFAGQSVNPCLDCKHCVWFGEHTKCPGRKNAKKK
jgi:NADPH2 dehydrogenase